MTFNETYGFKVSKSQFHIWVPETHFEQCELPTLLEFEKACLSLKNQNKPLYSMIECGSNQAYYSLLFKHILGKDVTKNVMVEPFLHKMTVGEEEFKLNNCDGIFYNRGIGTVTHDKGQEEESPSPEITLREIFNEQSIDELDVLHSDIDGQERVLLEGSPELFEQRRINWVFLATHNPSLHTFCMEFLNNFKYRLIQNAPLGTNRGDDGWLIYSKD